MIVTKCSESRNHHIADEDIGYLQASQFNLAFGINYHIAGLVIASRRVLYLVHNARCYPHVGLYDSILFNIIDKKLPKNWVYSRILKSNLKYGSFSFQDFDYFGIDRILTETFFYERYFDGGLEETAFVEEQMAISGAIGSD